MYTNTLVQNAATTLQMRSAQMCVSSARWRVDDVIKTSSGFNETLYFSMELLACLSRLLKHQCHTSLLRAFMTPPVHFFSGPKKICRQSSPEACRKNLLTSCSLRNMSQGKTVVILNFVKNASKIKNEFYCLAV